jgi:hypothetical protein
VSFKNPGFCFFPIFPGTEFLKDEFHPRFPMVKNWQISNLRIGTPKKFAHLRFAD